MSNDNDSIKINLKGTDAKAAKLAQKVDHSGAYVNEDFENIAKHTEYLEKQSRRNNFKTLGGPESTDENIWDVSDIQVKALLYLSWVVWMIFHKLDDIAIITKHVKYLKTCREQLRKDGYQSIFVH